MDKQRWLHCAEIFDSLRIYPRLLIGAWSAFTMVTGYQTLHWFFLEPANSRGFEEALVVVGIFNGGIGMVKWMYSDYKNSGRDWSDQPPSTSSTMTTTTTSLGAST